MSKAIDWYSSSMGSIPRENFLSSRTKPWGDLFLCAVLIKYNNDDTVVIILYIEYMDGCVYMNGCVDGFEHMNGYETTVCN